MAPKQSARGSAALALGKVLGEGQSLDNALRGEVQQLTDRRDAALAHELAFGTMRYLPRLDGICEKLLTRKLRTRDAPVRIALLLGLYQLLYTRIPARAAISESVNLLSSAKLSWGRPVVNACLRRFQRERDALISAADADPVARLAHPKWLIDRLREDWPARWESMVTANNARAPMTLRVNTSRDTRAAYLSQLEQVGIESSVTTHSAVGITLAVPQPAESLPGFDIGAVAVQDEASQLAAELLGARSEHRVLDACAAPGGKTAHILENSGDVTLVAIDHDAVRVDAMNTGLARLGHNVTCLHADACKPDAWWDGQPFDRILLDAPCSATGVIRRHPDIKTLRRPTDIEPLLESQSTLLDRLWPLLAEGGMLMYATCSVFKAENVEQVVRFLSRQPDAEHVPFDATWGLDTKVGRQILPGHDGMDGFYYALLAKR